MGNKGEAMSSKTRMEVFWWVAVALLALPLLGVLDRALPAQAPAAGPGAKVESPRPLSDADARAFQALQVTILEARIMMARAEKEFTETRDRHDKAVAEIQALSSRLRKEYGAAGCNLDAKLAWVSARPDPVTGQPGVCVPEPQTADGRPMTEVPKPKPIRPEKK